MGSPCVALIWASQPRGKPTLEHRVEILTAVALVVDHALDAEMEVLVIAALA